MEFSGELFHTSSLFVYDLSTAPFMVEWYEIGIIQLLPWKVASIQQRWAVVKDEE